MARWQDDLKSLHTGHEVRRKGARTRLLVAAQREGAKDQQEPRSLTAMLLGDPLPGRSALDQRRQRMTP